MSTQLTVADLRQALPKSLQGNATQDFCDRVNGIVDDPELAREVKENFLTYSKVLSEGKYKTEDYLHAVTYVTFKLMGYTNKDAYAKTFPDRYNVLVLRGSTDKDISAYVSAYHKNKLVNNILEQSVIPTWLLNQDAYQKAINVQLDLMMNAKSEKVQTDAANSLLTHLKAPEVKKFELDVSVKREGGIADLAATMEAMAQQQLELIKSGMGAREVAHTKLISAPEEAIDAEFIDLGAQPQAALLPHTGPVPDPVPLPHVDPAPAPVAPLQRKSLFDTPPSPLPEPSPETAGATAAQPPASAEAATGEASEPVQPTASTRTLSLFDVEDRGA